ncbi:TPA: DUF1240 domain-containing protein [Enterobacter hormaechei]
MKFLLLFFRVSFIFFLFGGSLYLSLFGFIMKDFISLINMGEVITYNKTLIFIGGIPLILYACITVPWALISSKTSPFRNMGNIHTLIICFCVFTFVIGFVLSFVIQSMLLIYYTPCPQEHLSDFYVTDLKLCENLKPRGFW